MNPELEQKLDELQKQIDAIRQANDLEYAESVKVRVVGDYARKNQEIANATVNQSVGATEAFDAPNAFDKEVILDIGGDLLKIGGYNV